MKYQKNLLDYLEASASNVPDKTAFSDETGEVSFHALLSQSRGIGTAVAGTSAKGSPVAVVVDRTAETIAAFMGVLQAGCFYVPIDPNMPDARLKSIINTLRPELVLYAEGQEKTAEGCGCKTMLIADAAATVDDNELLAERRSATLDIDPAYCIFTSGSTGVPKGIVVSHRSVIDFTEWYTEVCGITGGDILGNQAPFYFDLSVKDIYSTLKTGATTHILPKKFFLFPILLVRFLNEKKVTVLSWATSAFHLIANSGALKKAPVESLRTVITGGEALQAKQVNVWKAAMPRIKFINLYGPTEVTVDCTYYILDRAFADGEPIPIGKACENMEVMLLDEELKPSDKGEICVRGAGLALGYYGDWDKTDAAFIQNPMNPHYPDRVYRTGDMGTMGEDGNIYFLARKDNQIKHMGYRIELGEVETALSGLDSVQAAVCFFDAEKDKIVCVCQTEKTGEDIAVELRKSLPKYMIPNIYRIVRNMPYNANGKIDRVRLKKEYEDGKDN